MINIAIICRESHDREIMTTILSKQKDFCITSIGTDSYDALRSAKIHHPDIIIMDFNTGGNNCMELVPIIKRHSPSTNLIVLCACEDPENIRLALSIGISGCLLQRELDNLAPSIRCVYHGGLYLSHSIKTQVLQRVVKTTKKKVRQNNADSINKITARKYLSYTDMRIFFGILLGYTDREIAKNLNICEGAVRNCITRVKRKTGLHNRTQMAVLTLFFAQLNNKNIKGQLADFS